MGMPMNIYKSLTIKNSYEQGSDWTVISFAFNRYPLTNS